MFCDLMNNLHRNKMGTPKEHISLSHLNSIIQSALNNTFSMQYFWVVADITEHSFKEANGYHYFELVEKDQQTNRITAKIKGAAWGSASLKIKAFENATGQKFTNNINVLVRVKVRYHQVFGLSLDLEDIDSNFTLGFIESKRQASLQKLLSKYPHIVQYKGDQWVTRNALLELSPVISRVAVISSETSAGNEDFRHSLLNNPYGYHFEIDNYYTAVQNEDNSALFLQKILDIYNSGIPYDAVVINRGGGSQTDFLLFDDFKISLAIAKFPVPVITGIGHHKNETIVDLMAHTRTKTLTKAAEFIITHNKAFEDQLLFLRKEIILKSRSFLADEKSGFQHLQSLVLNTSRTLLQHRRNSLSALEQAVAAQTVSAITRNRRVLEKHRYILQSLPRMMVNTERKNMEIISSGLALSAGHFLSAHHRTLKSAVAVLKIISPENILRKGFALVKNNGKITGDPKQFLPGSEIEVILGTKSIKSTVNTNTEYHGNDFNLPESL